MSSLRFAPSKKVMVQVERKRISSSTVKVNIVYITSLDGQYSRIEAFLTVTTQEQFSHCDSSFDIFLKDTKVSGGTTLAVTLRGDMPEFVSFVVRFVEFNHCKSGQGDPRL